jgi:hypothetical protein
VIPFAPTIGFAGLLFARGRRLSASARLRRGEYGTGAERRTGSRSAPAEGPC